MVMWLMNEAKGVEKSLNGLARRMLAVNFAAIHTTSIVSCLSRYDLRDISKHLHADTHASVVSPSCQSGVH